MDNMTIHTWEDMRIFLANQKIERFVTNSKYHSVVHNRMGLFKFFWEDERQRMGQAFFNALSNEHQNILAGSLVDPFHWDSEHMIMVALDYLMDQLTKP